MNISVEDGAKGSVPWSSPAWDEKARIAQEWRSPKLEELMPDLSRDEQLRLQNRIRERDRVRRRINRKCPPSSSLSSSNSNLDSASSEHDRDAALIPLVLDGIRHYNARHPGGEFDIVKPLMQSRVQFRGQIWAHINFWACSRTNSKMIKRFFAEIHYTTFPNYPKGCWDPSKPIDLIPIVEICTIIEEPLCQYKRSCGFCLAYFYILHPKGCRKFVCGNDKERIGQRLERCWAQPCDLSFADFIERGPT